MMRIFALLNVAAFATAQECPEVTAAVAAGATTAEACTAPAAETPVNGACAGAGQTYVGGTAAVWDSTASTCDDVGGTNPATEAECTALFSVAESCTPPTCTLVAGTDCSTDTNAADTGCTYTAPVPLTDQPASCTGCSATAVTCTAFDCSADDNDLNASPGDVTCAADPCTAAECCTVTPTAAVTCTAFDCSADDNDLNASPGDVTCAADPCTAAECCTVTPTVEEASPAATPPTGSSATVATATVATATTVAALMF